MDASSSTRDGSDRVRDRRRPDDLEPEPRRTAARQREAHTTPLEGSGLVGDADEQPQGAAYAVDHANVVRRGRKKHIFVVAVGEGSRANSRNRIVQISGPDELVAGGSFGEGRADFTFVGFAQLEAALKGLATELCAASVKLTKEVDADGDGAVRRSRGRLDVHRRT